MVGVDGVGIQRCAVRKDGHQARVIRARQMQRIETYGETFNSGNNCAQTSESRHMVLPASLWHSNVVFPDDDVGQHVPVVQFSSFSGDRRVNCWLSNSQTRRTCRSVVRMLPIERRRVSLSFSFVCDRNASPVALTPCMIASFSASSLAACAVALPLTGGDARKHTRANGAGAINSQ